MNDERNWLGWWRESPDSIGFLYIFLISSSYFFVNLIPLSEARGINLVPESFVAIHASVSRMNNLLAASVYHWSAVLLMFLPAKAVQVDERKLLAGGPVAMFFRRLTLMVMAALAMWFVVFGNTSQAGLDFAAWMGSGTGFFLASHLLGGGGLGFAVGMIKNFFRTFQGE